MEIVPNHHNQWNPADAKMLFHAVLPQWDQRAQVLKGVCNDSTEEIRDEWKGEF